MNAVCNLDLFAVPVSLTYQGKTRFSTQCGGCFSLLLIIALLTYSSLLLYQLIVHPVLQSYSESIYFSVADNTEWYNIPTKTSTLAIAMNGTIDQTEISRFLRVVYS